MAFAQGSRTRLAIGEQADFTTDAAAMKILPYNSHSLDLTKARVASSEINSDRMPRVDRHGNREVSGDIVGELRSEDFDLLIESALFSDFAAGTGNRTISNGVTPKFLTVEDGALDIAQYRKFQSLAVTSMNISAGPNAMIMGTFGMVGRNLVQSGSELHDPSAVTGGEPWDSYSGAITEGGSTIALITALDFTLTNSFGPTFVLGSAVTPQLEYGNSIVEGTMTAYYEDAVLINKFLNETESALTIEFDDPTSGGAYTFSFPRTKLNGASVPVGSPQSRLISIPFIALYDSSAGHQLEIVATD